MYASRKNKWRLNLKVGIVVGLGNLQKYFITGLFFCYRYIWGIAVARASSGTCQIASSGTASYSLLNGAIVSRKGTGTTASTNTNGRTQEAFTGTSSCKYGR